MTRDLRDPRRPRLRPPNSVVLLLTAGIGGWLSWLAFVFLADGSGSTVRVGLGVAMTTCFLALFHVGALVVKNAIGTHSRF